jgi:hypothetical protein
MACYISGAVYKGVPVLVNKEYTYLWESISSSKFSSDISVSRVFSVTSLV